MRMRIADHEIHISNLQDTNLVSHSSYQGRKLTAAWPLDPLFITEDNMFPS